MHDPEAEALVERQLERQEVIDAVLASHGGHPASEVRTELERALGEAGMVGDSEAWLTAVAGDLSLGHVYVVSARTRDLALENADHELPGG